MRRRQLHLRRRQASIRQPICVNMRDRPHGLTLKSDDKGRYALGRFLPRRTEVRVEKHPDGSVTLHPLKPRMSRGQIEAFVSSRAGTWQGPISGEKLLKMTRGA